MNDRERRYTEWRSGHWSGDRPDHDAIHEATRDAFDAALDLAAEQNVRLLARIAMLQEVVDEHDFTENHNENKTNQR